MTYLSAPCRRADRRGPRRRRLQRGCRPRASRGCARYDARRYDARRRVARRSPVGRPGRERCEDLELTDREAARRRLGADDQLGERRRAVRRTRAAARRARSTKTKRPQPRRAPCGRPRRRAPRPLDQASGVANGQRDRHTVAHDDDGGRRRQQQVGDRLQRVCHSVSSASAVETSSRTASASAEAGMSCLVLR